MEQRPLGHTGLTVSKICLGTMTFGAQNSEAEGHEQLDFALDNGVNFLDAAEMYSVPVKQETWGRTEEIIGTWLAGRKKRDDVIVATKVCGRSTGFSWARPHIHGGITKLDRQSIKEACDASLKRLQTDYIDLYQMHWPDRQTNYFGKLNYEPPAKDVSVPLAESLSAMGELIKEGKVRAVGVSNETPWGVMECLRLAEVEGLPMIHSIQNPYNLLMRTYEIGLAEVSIETGVGCLAYSPLAMGVLSGKYMDGNMPEGSRMALFPDYFPRYMKPLAQRETVKYVNLARKHGLDPTEFALAFVNDRPFMTSNIIGATSVGQLKACLKSASLTLSDEVLEEIDEIHLETPIPCQA